MRKKPPTLDQAGQIGGPEPGTARPLLAWLEALCSCSSQEELARRAKVDSRTLRRLAAGMGGRGTLGRLTGSIGVPLWVVREGMLPAITATGSVWRESRGGTGSGLMAARNQALGVAVRIAALTLSASRGRRSEVSIPAGKRSWAALHPMDVRALIRWLEELGEWSKEELARNAGLTRQTLWLYASGGVAMGKLAVRSLVEGAGVPYWLAEAVMLPAITGVRLIVEYAQNENLPVGWTEALTAASEAALAQDVGFSLHRLLEATQREVATFEPSSADRKRSEEQWRQLSIRNPVERVLLIKNCRVLQSWELAERLCTESREAASDSANVAWQMALLALRVAKLVRDDARFRDQLQGYALIHLANALRVAGRLRRAEEALARGLDLWYAGASSKHSLLPSWRVLDLEASLRRDQRRFEEALARLEQALAAAPRDAWGRILLKKASVLDQMGTPAEAIAALDDAAPFVDAEKEPRHLFMWFSIRGANLCHLGRFEEAQELLPKAEELGAKLQRALDLVRLEWLRGRILSGLGDREGALTALRSVQEEFRTRDMAYDYALVSLEAGAIMLQQSRYQEAKDLALKLEWTFTEEGVHPEAAKALDLFRQAVQGQRATPELAQRVVRYLYQAQYDPELKFAA